MRELYIKFVTGLLILISSQNTFSQVLIPNRLLVNDTDNESFFIFGRIQKGTSG